MEARKYDDFDVHAEDYRNVHSRNVRITGADSFYYAIHKTNQIARFEVDGGLQVLDLGCGDGTLVKYLEERFPHFSITGLDISLQSIEKAKQLRLKSNFIQFNGLEIPFSSGSFDMVIVASVMHHIDFTLHEKWLKEVMRILKPGGRVYVFEHNPVNPATRWIVKTCVFDKDAKLLSHSYAKRLFKKIGFEDIRVHFVLFFPRIILRKMFDSFEKFIEWLPLGGQYVLRARKVS
jgi:ubiquinone/menaquinone biosynthesis C-methylase UbiE